MFHAKSLGPLPLLIMLIVGILYFISFCVDGVGSVLNDTHFVSCYDRS